MKSTTSLVAALCCALLAFCFKSTSASASAAAISKAAIFPALQRRKLEQQQQKQKQQKQDQQDQSDEDDDDDDEEQTQAQPEPVQKQVAANVDASAQPTALPAVPPPPIVGAAGFPELPAVSNMLGAAANSVKSISTQAKTLESQVVQTQMENEAKLARQKAVFEKKLKTQEEQNREVIAANSKISKTISDLKNSNAESRQHAQSLQEVNKLMRTELRTLQSKVVLAQAFIVSSLKSTDDSKSQELSVLRVKKGLKHRAARREEAFMEVDQQDRGYGPSDADADADNADDEEAASFLALQTKRAIGHSIVAAAADDDADSSGNEDPLDAASVAAEPTKAPDVNARDVLTALSKDVEAMQKEGQDSQKQLRAMFLGAFQTGAKRHAALIAQQKALNATSGSLQQLQSELNNAVRHLDVTREALNERLRGIGLYMQKLSHLALAPNTEAHHLLETLPSKVSIAPLPKKMV